VFITTSRASPGGTTRRVPKRRDATRRDDDGDDGDDGVSAVYSGTNERAIERDRSTAVVALRFPLQRGKNRRGVGSRGIAVSSASWVSAIARERREET